MIACGTTARGDVLEAPAAPDPRDYTLRLSDLDPGYRLGNDWSCRIGAGAWEPEGPDSAYLLDECNVDFRRMWTPRRRGPAEPRSVDSYAWVLPTDADAAAHFRSATEDAPGSFQPIGDEARLTRRLLRYRVTVVNRRTGRVRYRWAAPDARAEIRWRSGRFLARIVIDGSAARVTRTAILRLARKQQARIATPVPLTPADVDDSAVGLDDPNFGVPVLWLGSRFEPGGGLPALELLSSGGGGGDFDTGPGWTGELQYGSERYAADIVIGIWKPKIWRESAKRRFGRVVWGSRCALSRSFAVSGGRATIYAGYSVRGDTCDGRQRDSYMAIVRRKHTVVTVNMPLCYSCLTGGAYSSFDGLETVVRGLHPRRRPR